MLVPIFKRAHKYSVRKNNDGFPQLNLCNFSVLYSQRNFYILQMFTNQNLEFYQEITIRKNDNNVYHSNNATAVLNIEFAKKKKSKFISQRSINQNLETLQFSFLIIKKWDKLDQNFSQRFINHNSELLIQSNKTSFIITITITTSDQSIKKKRFILTLMNLTRSNPL